MYDERDMQRASARVRAGMRRLLLMMAPFLAVAVAGFVLRIKPMCMAGAVIASFIMIFQADTRLSPAMRYRKWLSDALQGRRHDTAGMLMRLAQEETIDDGLRFRELIINIYADLSEEGERRFLLDASKDIPGEYIGQVVVVRSYDHYVMDLWLRGDEREGQA